MIKKIFLTVALTVSLFSSEYKVDKDYSTIKFEVSKLLFVGVEGTFSDFKGTIYLDDNNKLTSIHGVVSINSINTSDEQRDNHLKADDYFDVSSFPHIIFKSNVITNEMIKATVNIKGIKKELTFKLSDFSVSENNINFKLSSIVDRQQFMLNGSKSGLFSDDIEVTANLVAVKSK